MARKVLITGASGGIGLRIARALAASNHSLVLQGHRNVAALASFASGIPNPPTWLSADFTTEEGLQRVVDAAEHCEVVLHCAGIPSAGISWKISAEEFRKVNAINYEAPFFLSQRLIPAMRKRGWGRIVFFSSIVAQTGIPGTAAYSASKSALFGLTRTMASELASCGITVNCIAPGYMDEGMIREIPDDMRAQIIAKTPIAKLGDTAGIVKMVEMLLSDEANSITGQVLSVNGGLWM
ncbi:MAG: SDR family oxidoreductase [Flavobacteriia bacterium]|nr:SDR family oxidoreductase [Flavobacteriia bacterium]NBX39076.1 SDR family oxidoreductase [Flavobacteriia bacterium]